MEATKIFLLLKSFKIYERREGSVSFGSDSAKEPLKDSLLAESC